MKYNVARKTMRAEQRTTVTRLNLRWDQRWSMSSGVREERWRRERIRRGVIRRYMAWVIR